METTRTTKYFGVVEPQYRVNSYGDSYAYFYTDFNDQEISVCIEDYDKYGDKLALVWKMVDKYIEIHEIAKKAIIENFQNKKSVVYEYFNKHFTDDFYFTNTDKYYKKYGVTDFKNIDIISFLEKMNYTGLYFEYEDETITIILDYYIYKTGNDLDTELNVLLDEELNIKDFEIDWGS
jgi:hypothetical protein